MASPTPRYDPETYGEHGAQPEPSAPILYHCGVVAPRVPCCCETAAAPTSGSVIPYHPNEPTQRRRRASMDSHSFGSCSRRCFCCVPEHAELLEWEQQERAERNRQARAARHHTTSALYQSEAFGVAQRPYRSNTAHMLRCSQGSLYQRAVAVEQERRREALREELQTRRRERSAHARGRGGRQSHDVSADAPMVYSTGSLRQHSQPRSARPSPRRRWHGAFHAPFGPRRHHKTGYTSRRDTTTPEQTCRCGECCKCKHPCKCTCKTSRRTDMRGGGGAQAECGCGYGGVSKCPPNCKCGCKTSRRTDMRGGGGAQAECGCGYGGVSKCPPNCKCGCKGKRGGRSTSAKACPCNPCACCPKMAEPPSADVVASAAQEPRAPSPKRASSEGRRSPSPRSRSFGTNYGRKIYITDDSHHTRRSEIIRRLEREGYVRQLPLSNRSPSAPLPEKTRKWETTRSTSAHRV